MALPDNYIVYFVECVDPESEYYGLVKIGCTKDFKRRKPRLEQHYGALIVLGWIKGYKAEEQELHSRFELYRVKGEWFIPEGDLDDYLIQVETSAPPEMAGIGPLSSARANRRGRMEMLMANQAMLIEQVEKLTLEVQELRSQVAQAEGRVNIQSEFIGNNQARIWDFYKIAVHLGADLSILPNYNEIDD